MEKKQFNFNTICLFAILAIAAILRFWNFSEISFMHDELSGLFRAQASTLMGVIEETKQTDVHPFGIPIFIHYWTLFFGDSEQAVKFPFIIMSLAAIFFTYKIAEKWFNATVGLITAAFMASLQYTTMYGQLARPYASGIFFSVLMVWFFTKFFTEEENKKQYKSLLGFILASVLCAYNHYFSLLFAGLVWGSGLFFISKKNYLRYLLSGAGIILLCIPQIPILLQHFSIGGASENDWIGKPDASWIWGFIKYLFHYSRWVYAIVCFVFIASLFYFDKTKKITDKFRITTLVWGVLSFLIAYFYSVYKNPVLQFSTLTFSFPFLLLFIFSFYKDVSAPIKTTLLILILSVNIYTLIYNRKHFDLFYKQAYEEMAKISLASINEYGAKNVAIAYKIPENFMNYYFKKYNRPFSYYKVEKIDLKSFKEFLDLNQKNYFIAGNLPLEYVQLIRATYPYLIKKEEGFTCNIYCFSKEPKKDLVYESVVFESTNSFEKTIPYWNKEAIGIKIDSNKTVFKLDSTIEYGPTFSAKLKDITKGKHNILNVSTTIDFTDTKANPVLVMDISEAGKSIIWRGGEKNWYKKSKQTDELYISQLISELDLVKHPDLEIKIYVWNSTKKSIAINNIKINVVESNPYIFGLYSPL